MDSKPGSIRLTFELPPELASGLVKSAADLATTHTASIELVDVRPRSSPVEGKYQDSEGSLFTEVQDSEGNTQRVVTTENLADFFRANGIDDPAPAAHIINAIVRLHPGGGNEDEIGPYVHRPQQDVRWSPYMSHAIFTEQAGIKVDTAPELMDKIKSGEINVYGLGSKRQALLEAYMEKLFTSVQESTEVPGAEK